MNEKKEKRSGQPDTRKIFLLVIIIMAALLLSKSIFHMNSRQFQIMCFVIVGACALVSAAIAIYKTKKQSYSRKDIPYLLAAAVVMAVCVIVVLKGI